MSDSIKIKKVKLQKLKANIKRLRESCNLIRIKNISVKALDIKIAKLESENKRLRKAGDEMSYIIGSSFKGPNAKDRWVAAKLNRVIK